MKASLLLALGLTLALSSTAAQADRGSSLSERLLCRAGLQSHCLENATINNPIIINKRPLCPKSRCLDNATVTNPVIINKRTVCPKSRCLDNATTNNPVIINR